MSWWPTSGEIEQAFRQFQAEKRRGFTPSEQAYFDALASDNQQWIVRAATDLGKAEGAQKVHQIRTIYGVASMGKQRNRFDELAGMI